METSDWVRDLYLAAGVLIVAAPVWAGWVIVGAAVGTVLAFVPEWRGTRYLGLLFLGLGTVAHAGTERLDLVAIVRDGVDGVRGLHAPVAMTLSPGGEHVYVASAADNALAVFRREPTTGQLSFVDTYFDGVGGVEGLGGIAGPRPLSVSPDGRHLYVAASADAAVAVFRRDPMTGTLAFVEVQVDGVSGVDGLAGAWAATVSPDGRHVYTAGFADRAVSVFARDATTGALSFVEAHVDGVGGIIGLHDP